MAGILLVVLLGAACLGGAGWSCRRHCRRTALTLTRTVTVTVTVAPTPTPTLILDPTLPLPLPLTRRVKQAQLNLVQLQAAGNLVL